MSSETVRARPSATVAQVGSGCLPKTPAASVAKLRAIAAAAFVYAELFTGKAYSSGPITSFKSYACALPRVVTVYALGVTRFA